MYPVNIEAEKKILGTLITYPETRYLIDTLHESDFYEPLHQWTIKALKEMHKEGQAIETFLINENLKSMGYEVHLTQLFNIVETSTTSTSIGNYISVLKDKAVKRHILDQCKRTIESIGEDQLKAIEIQTELLKSVEEVAVIKEQENDDLYSIMKGLIQQLEHQYEMEEDKRYYTGLAYYDKVTGGLHRQEITCIAGRPGTGKTAVGGQIGINVAMNGLKVLMVSREMSKLQLAKRILSHIGRIDGDKLKGKIDANTLQTGVRKAAEIAGSIGRRFIIDTDSKRVSEIRAKLRKEKADLLILDYLQLLSPDTSKDIREQEVAIISREMKEISIKFNIPVLLLAQLNRSAENQRPNKGQLRESGSIEQDADNILLLHRPTDKELNKMMDDDPCNIPFLKKLAAEDYRLIDFILDKQRNGSEGEWSQIFNPKQFVFYDIKEERA